MTELSNVVRTVSVWSNTKGRTDFETSVGTIEELKAEIVSKGYDLNNVKVFEGNTESDWTIATGNLPVNIEKRGTVTNNLVVILSSRKKLDLGARDTEVYYVELPYKDVKRRIKETIKEEGVAAKEHFGNYTIKTTRELNELFFSWNWEEFKKENKMRNETATVTKHPYFGLPLNDDNLFPTDLTGEEVIVPIKNVLKKLVEIVTQLETDYNVTITKKKQDDVIVSDEEMLSMIEKFI